MATKSSTKKGAKKTAQKHDLLYIMSPTCGWCKKSDPVVDELIKDGYKITKLDVTNPDEGKRANEVKQKFNAQCGTPLFLDGETGNMKCGFAEKDIIEKWAKGEEIPAPPRPKSPPPPPPTDFDDEGQIKDFTEKYNKWAKENDHLPKILPVEQILERMKAARQAQMNAPQNQGAPGAPSVNSAQGVGAKNLQFYYVVENNQRVAVMSDPTFISSLQPQYYFRESDGKLSKVVGDANWKTNVSPANNVQPPVKGAPVKPKVSEKEIKDKVQKAKQKAIQEKNKISEKSKSNKKTVKGL